MAPPNLLHLWFGPRRGDPGVGAGGGSAAGKRRFHLQDPEAGPVFSGAPPMVRLHCFYVCSGEKAHLTCPPCRRLALGIGRQRSRSNNEKEETLNKKRRIRKAQRPQYRLWLVQNIPDSDKPQWTEFTALWKTRNGDGHTGSARRTIPLLDGAVIGRMIVLPATMHQPDLNGEYSPAQILTWSGFVPDSFTPRKE